MGGNRSAAKLDRVRAEADVFPRHQPDVRSSLWLGDSRDRKASRGRPKAIGEKRVKRRRNGEHRKELQPEKRGLEGGPCDEGSPNNTQHRGTKKKKITGCSGIIVVSVVYFKRPRSFWGTNIEEGGWLVGKVSASPDQPDRQRAKHTGVQNGRLVGSHVADHRHAKPVFLLACGFGPRARLEMP